MANGAERDPAGGVRRAGLLRRGTGRRPTGYAFVAAVVIAGVLVLFGLVQWAAVPLLTDPVPVLRTVGSWAALLGVGLLTVDVLLPVPSSVVMVMHGVLFGLVPGAGLSLLGGTGATLVGFQLGRWGRPVVERVTTPAQRERADRLLSRWGALAVLITRPVPVVAETVAVLAGTSPMRWHVAAIAGATGTLPPALVYAAAGAAGRTVLGAVLGAAAVLCLLVLLTASPVVRRCLVPRAERQARDGRDGRP